MASHALGAGCLHAATGVPTSGHAAGAAPSAAQAADLMAAAARSAAERHGDVSPSAAVPTAERAGNAAAAAAAAATTAAAGYQATPRGALPGGAAPPVGGRVTAAAKTPPPPSSTARRGWGSASTPRAAPAPWGRRPPSLLPDVAVHPVANRLLSPWGVAAGRLGVLGAAVAALPPPGGGEVLALASSHGLYDVPLTAFLLCHAGHWPAFVGDGGAAAAATAAVASALDRLPAGTAAAGVLSPADLPARHMPPAGRGWEGRVPPATRRQRASSTCWAAAPARSSPRCVHSRPAGCWCSHRPAGAVRRRLATESCRRRRSAPVACTW